MSTPNNREPGLAPRAAARGQSPPAVPLTIEGSSVLHHMLRLRWADWKALPYAEQSSIAGQAAALLEEMEAGPAGAQSAAYSLIGHKGDLLLVHFRSSFEELAETERRLARLALWDYLEPASSFLSMVELGLYESTAKLYSALAQREVEPFSEAWTSEVEATLERQREAMRPRLFPQIPASRYICFYPMDRRRGEVRNWYQEPLAERQRMMRDHGLVGRRYAGVVRQIVTGSIGFDDWEWGVDLFADDPLEFKKLIYEMRFDEVSAVYAQFGPFYIGVRLPAGELVRNLVTSEGPPAASK